MPAIKITSENFESEVVNSGKTFLLDFWAPWCGPCRMVSPIVEEIASEHPEITVGKVNVDVETELAAKFRIMSIPALFVIRDGKIAEQAVGALPKERILELLK